MLLSVKPVDIAISAAAIQTLEGKSVVFVRNGDKFEAREVELGGRDGERVRCCSACCRATSMPAATASS